MATIPSHPKKCRCRQCTPHKKDCGCFQCTNKRGSRLIGEVPMTKKLAALVPDHIYDMIMDNGGSSYLRKILQEEYDKYEKPGKTRERDEK